MVLLTGIALSSGAVLFWWHRISRTDAVRAGVIERELRTVARVVRAVASAVELVFDALRLIGGVNRTPSMASAGALRLGVRDDDAA